MSDSIETERVLGQPSWRLTSSHVDAYLTQLGGHLGPVAFRLGEREIKPYAVCPWAEERVDPDIPPMLRVLRGDFFCMPFGANEARFRHEQHPPHGETANMTWQLESIETEANAITLHASLTTAVREGRVDKYIRLCDNQTAVYCQHVISGMSGPMSLGHHAMLKFPTAPGSGIVTTSLFVHAQTAPFPIEQPENQGYSLLQPGASIESLEDVPTITHQTANLCRYPARQGFEDLVMLVADPAASFAWTAVTFSDQRFVWFALKDPSVLRQTILWLSNGGRYYAPWNGRHLGVMGLEEVTSYFHYGLAESVEDNPISQRGYPTCLQLSADMPLDVRYIMAVAQIPEGFDRVQSIKASVDGNTVRLRSANGLNVRASVNLPFLNSEREA